MQSYKTTIESCGICIQIESDHVDVSGGLKNSPLLNTLIPSAKVLDAVLTKPKYIVRHIEADYQSLDELNGEFVFSDSWRAGLPNYIFHFLLKLFDFCYYEKGLLSFHASCVSLNKKGILLLAPPRGGKTTIALLLAKKFGGTFFSNNRCVVDPNLPLHMIAGTLKISMRSMSHPVLLSCHNNHNNKVSVSPTFFSDPNFWGVPFLEEDVEVAAFVILDWNQFYVGLDKLPKRTAIQELFKNSSLTMWGECLLFDGLEISPKLHNEVDAKNRLRRVRKIASNTSVYRASGTYEQMCQFIYEISKQ